MRDNYEETGFFLGEFKPDYDKLKRLEDTGFLRTFTARDHGKLIGYQVFFVSFGINCPKALIAMCHVAFVAKSHRGLTGIRFLQWADRQLMTEGATSISRQSTVHLDLSKLYSRMKYHKVEETWTKLNPFSIDAIHGGSHDGGDSIDPWGGP